jgi:hypothetical protein
LPGFSPTIFGIIICQARICCGFTSSTSSTGGLSQNLSSLKAMTESPAMPAIRIRPLPDGGRGPLGGAFTVESAALQEDAVDPPNDPSSPVVSTVVQFGRWISGRMSYYQNRGGVEDSSLFKSFTAECFEELTRDVPEAAACLTDLIVICDELPAHLLDDPAWRLHRAILATLPGVRFIG